MIKAFGKRVLVSLVDLNKDEKVGSLLLPSKDNMITGSVVGFGFNVDDGIDLGDIIYFNKIDGVPVKINGDDYVSVHENSIVAAWKDK